MIDSSYRLREKADYDDFYIVSKDEAKAQLSKAEAVVSAVEKYLADTERVNKE